MEILGEHRFPVTDRWLAGVPPLPTLADPAAQLAERLVLLLHYGIDWSENNWVAARRGDYWDNSLPTRVRLATYNSINLHQWWTASAARLGSAPRTDEQRSELAMLLTSEARPVLQVMRDQTTALTLLARIVADAVRPDRRRPEVGVVTVTRMWELEMTARSPISHHRDRSAHEDPATRRVSGAATKMFRGMPKRVLPSLSQRRTGL
ncbi:hypothetical protein [Rhodococcus pseudokoreensis]|uniref:hypothetical protein n=1 Tax=Rhodococcus pseudokoreensis TaxID=2811421 RepID=UPI001F126CBE|nr:hypothetical protein [Rhodococcus pseudokoreensis]